MYAIDTNVSLPDYRSNAKYPFKTLNVGDSFLVNDKPYKTIQAACSAANRRLSKQFIARVVPGGVRVWRLS